LGRFDIGTVVSGGGHAAVILWVLFGGFWFSPQDAPAMAATEVSLLSAAEFDALVAAAPTTPKPAEKPALPEVTPPAPVEPALDALEPQPKPTEDPAPAQETPKPQVEPAPEAAPDTTELAAVPAPDVAVAPDQTTPQVAPEDPVALPSPTPPTKPRAAPRVAPLPVEAPDPTVQIDDQTVAAVTPDAAPDAPAVTEEKPATAQEEAGTVIQTEATEKPPEVPVLAPASSARPKSRPTRTAAAEVAPAVSEPAADPAPDADAEAIAAALAEAAATPADDGTTGGGNTAPQGPPMTSGEKDGLRVAVSTCWIVDTGSQSADVTVTIGLSMNQNGTVVPGSLELIGAEGGSSDAQRSAFEKARRAILRCEKGGYPLPQDKYEQWKDIEMVFNPDGMRLR
jgi:hypothetical protein